MKLNVQLLRETFDALRPQGDAIVASFYSILFTRHPEIGKMFAKTNMEEQRKKFFATLDELIHHLEEPDKTMADLLVLGNHHLDYGVKNEQYPLVCDALVEAMKQHAGALWTAEVEKAWRDAYATVADFMKKGAALRRPNTR
jgi:nitric oxide dioxygenase